MIFKKGQYILNISLANNWTDNEYLLIGQINTKILFGSRVYMLISQNTYFYLSKNSNKKFPMYILTIYVRSYSFMKKTNIFVIDVKKIKYVLEKALF
jgi:hypothetical protein